MRVALVVPDLDGAGAQRVMLDLAAGLLAAGVEVDIVAVRATGSLRTSVPSGAELVDLGARRAVTALPALIRYFRRRRPESAVGVFEPRESHHCCRGAIARGSTRVVVTQHNHISTATPHKTTTRARLLPRFLAVAFRSADEIVAVSGGVADDLAETFGIARSRVRVIYNAVDFARLEQAAREPQGPGWPGHDGPQLLGVGRLTAQKDFATLLRAVALLPDARLLLLGEGEDRARLETLVAELSISDRVRLMGHVDNPFPYFRTCDVFVLSSRWEGLPTVLIEALALAPRVVSTDCPSGPREILDGGTFGPLVPVGDPVALAEAIRSATNGVPGDHRTALERYRRADVTEAYLAVIRG